MELKVLPRESVPRALQKAERYRLLNDPSAAESICRDVLAVDPDNQECLVMLILALADQHAHPDQPLALVPRLASKYEQVYYRGIVCERWAKAQLGRATPGTRSTALAWLRDAMSCYEQAQSIAEHGNDDAILRWNSCVRTIEAHKLADVEGERESPYHD